MSHVVTFMTKFFKFGFKYKVIVKQTSLITLDTAVLVLMASIGERRGQYCPFYADCQARELTYSDVFCMTGTGIHSLSEYSATAIYAVKLFLLETSQ